MPAIAASRAWVRHPRRSYSVRQHAVRPLYEATVNNTR